MQNVCFSHLVACWRSVLVVKIANSSNFPLRRTEARLHLDLVLVRVRVRDVLERPELEAVMF